MAVEKEGLGGGWEGAGRGLGGGWEGDGRGMGLEGGGGMQRYLHMGQ